MADFVTNGEENNIALSVWHDLADNLTVGAGYSHESDSEDAMVVEFIATF